jgi:hypothetical protein
MAACLLQVFSGIHLTTANSVICFSMRTIRCTTGEDTIVDDWNYDYFSQFNWHIQHGYVFRNSSNGVVYMHREVLHLVGHADFETADHIDNNSLDNRKANLRPATYSQNNQNRGLISTNRSGYTGVRWRAQRRKWVPRVDSNGRTTDLGHFEDLLEAIKVRDIAALHCYDAEFIVLNLGREHYPPGSPRDWPEESIPDCPALRRLINEDPTS